MQPDPKERLVDPETGETPPLSPQANRFGNYAFVPTLAEAFRLIFEYAQAHPDQPITIGYGDGTVGTIPAGSLIISKSEPDDAA